MALIDFQENSFLVQTFARFCYIYSANLTATQDNLYHFYYTKIPHAPLTLQSFNFASRQYYNYTIGPINYYPHAQSHQRAKAPVQRLLYHFIFAIVIISQFQLYMQQTIEKRENFRKEIRRESLENYFRNKREIILNSQTPLLVKTSLQNILENIAQRINLMQNIGVMANRLAKVRAFQEQLNIPQFSIEQFCTNLCKLILQSVIWQFRSDSKKDSQIRIGCLTIIVNLLADDDCPNHLLVDTIINFLDSYYVSVQIEGVNKEIVEVGWILGNLLGKQTLLHVNENKVSYILQWIQEVIVINNKNMISLIFRSLESFVKSCRKLYKLTEYDLPEVYKGRLYNIIALTVQKLLGQKASFQSSMSIISFVTEIIPAFLLFSSEELFEILINQCIIQLGSMFRKVFTVTLFLLQKIISYPCYTIEDIQVKQKIANKIDKIIILIARRYSQKILVFFCIKEMDLKAQLLHFLARLIENAKYNQQIIIDIFLEQGLEDKMITLLSSNNQDFISYSYQIVEIATKNNRNNFSRFINAAVEYSQQGAIFGVMRQEQGQVQTHL